MIERPRLGRRQAQMMRSQLALEVALNAYALVAAALLLRLGFLLLEISPRVWTSAAIYGLTDPVVWPLTVLPGGDRRLLGDAALADVTAVAVLGLAALVVIARDRSR